MQLQDLVYITLDAHDQPLKFPTRNAGEPAAKSNGKNSYLTRDGLQKSNGEKHNMPVQLPTPFFHHFPQFSSLRIDID